MYVRVVREGTRVSRWCYGSAFTWAPAVFRTIRLGRNVKADYFGNHSRALQGDRKNM